MIPSRFSTARRVLAWHGPWGAALSLLAVVAVAGSAAGMSPSGETGSEKDFPSHRGRVVFERPGTADRHIYIIGESHRSAQTGGNGPDTVAAQADVYRLSQWLIETHDVGLFLPEGFFEAGPRTPQSTREGTVPDRHWLDDVTLARRLSDTSVFRSAGTLLRESCSVRFRQVEDENLYLQALDLVSSRTGRQFDAEWLADLEQVQNRRSAVMLQNVAPVVQEEYRERRIRNQRVILTVGLAHLEEILRLLSRERMEVAPLTCPPARCPGFESELAWLDDDFGVTVIIPQSLWENRVALRVARLDHLTR